MVVVASPEGFKVVTDLKSIPPAFGVIVYELEGLDALTSRWPDVYEELVRANRVWGVRRVGCDLTELEIVGFQIEGDGDDRKLLIAYRPIGAHAKHVEFDYEGSFFIPSL